MAYTRSFSVSVDIPFNETEGISLNFSATKFPEGDSNALVVDCLRRTADYIEERGKAVPRPQSQSITKGES